MYRAIVHNLMRPRIRDQCLTQGTRIQNFTPAVPACSKADGPGGSLSETSSGPSTLELPLALCQPLLYLTEPLQEFGIQREEHFGALAKMHEDREPRGEGRSSEEGCRCNRAGNFLGYKLKVTQMPTCMSTNGLVLLLQCLCLPNSLNRWSAPTVVLFE